MSSHLDFFLQFSIKNQFRHPIFPQPSFDVLSERGKIIMSTENPFRHSVRQVTSIRKNSERIGNSTVFGSMEDERSCMHKRYNNDGVGVRGKRELS